MSIKSGLQKLGTKIATSAKANYPKWMVVGGSVLVVAAGISACVVTYKKLKPVVEEHKENVAKIKEEYKIKNDEVEKAAETEEVAEDTKAEKKEEYKEGYQKKIFWAYMTTTGKIVKMYALPTALVGAGLFCIFKGHMTTEHRYISAAAEGYAISEAFSAYRDRVEKRFGKVVEEELYRNAKHELVTEEVTDPETGEVKNVTKDELVADRPEETGIYEFIFDSCNCPHSWSKHPGYNYKFLVDIQNTANDYLKSHGAITLYEILKQLGAQDIDPDLMNKGWMIDNPICTDPNKAAVDFGIVRLAQEDSDIGCFAGGSPDYILRFNVQGDIQAAMKIKKEMERKRAQALKAKRAVKGAKAVIKGCA